MEIKQQLITKIKDAMKNINNKGYKYSIRNEELFCYQKSTDEETKLCSIKEIELFDDESDYPYIYLTDKHIKLTEYGPAFFI